MSTPTQAPPKYPIFAINLPQDQLKNQEKVVKIPMQDVKIIKDQHRSNFHLIKLFFHAVLFLILLATLLWLFFYYFSNKPADRKEEIRIEHECPEVPKDQLSSHLWEIKSDKLSSKNFLFGTNHIHYEAVWDTVSPSAKEAIFQADVIGLERTNNQARSPFMQCYFLDNNQTLKEILKPEVYEKLEQYLLTIYHKMTMIHPRVKTDLRLKAMIQDTLFNKFMHLKPFYFYLMFSAFIQQFKESLSFQAPKIVSLDSYIEYISTQANKTLISIETEESRCNPDLGNVDDLTPIFNYLPDISFDDLANAQKNSIIQTSESIKRYRCGILRPGYKTKTEKFIRYGFVPKNEHDSSEMTTLEKMVQRIEKGTLEDRNFIMAKSIHEYLHSAPELSHVFAAGLDHYTEEHNVRYILQKVYGYEIVEIRDFTNVPKN